VLVEHGTVPVGFLGVGDIRAPFGLGVLHHFIGNVELGSILEAINPAVTDTVGELLLLAPEDLLGEVGLDVGLVGSVEGLADDVLLDTLLVDHLLGGVNAHGGLKELLVQEGDTSLQTPGGGGLVGAQAVSQVQVLHTADGLLVELLAVGRSVEVQVSTEDFVAALTGQNHLDTHSLDLTGEQVHGSRSTDGGDIVGLQVVDNIGEGVQAVLNGESESVMLGAQELGDIKSCGGIGSAGETDGERVQLLEGGDGGQLVLVIDTDEI